MTIQAVRQQYDALIAAANATGQRIAALESLTIDRLRAVYRRTIVAQSTAGSLSIHCQGADGNLRVAERFAQAGPWWVATISATTGAKIGATETWPIPANCPSADPRIFGLLWTAGGMRWTVGKYYPVDSLSYATQVVGGVASVLDGVTPQRAAGGLCIVPGYEYGICPMQGPGSQYRCQGPGLYAVRADGSAVVMLDYTQSNPHPKYAAFSCGGGCIVGGSVVFGVSRAADGAITWYGEWNAGPGGATDPWDSSKGYHASAYVRELWVYRLADLRSVAAGSWRPWEPRETARIPLSEWTPPGSSPKGLVTCSFAGGRLVVGLQHYVPGSSDNRPRFLFFEGL